jgi:predicted HicB family RNase H-like nuclease
MKYKGYTGVVEYDEDAQCLHGRVIGIRDVITFQADNCSEIIKEFHQSVDYYLEFCAERGEGPEKSYSGQFVLRIDPKLHRQIVNAAREKSLTMNGFINYILENYFK